MLSPNLVNSLDMAAANGILDYDGAAFLTGTSPRYMGSPQFPVSGGSLKQPQTDQMIYSNPQKQQSKNPFWKKLLFGALMVGVGIFGLKKLKLFPSLKNTFTNLPNKVKNINTTKIKDGWTKVCDFFKNGFEKIFKKNPPPTP